MNDNHKKIVRILGVGNDQTDGHIRITQGDSYDVLQGDEQTHEYIAKLCADIEQHIAGLGYSLQDLSIEQLQSIIQEVVAKGK
jgi:hypothetical protein